MDSEHQSSIPGRWSRESSWCMRIRMSWWLSRVDSVSSQRWQLLCTPDICSGGFWIISSSSSNHLLCRRILSCVLFAQLSSQNIPSLQNLSVTHRSPLRYDRGRSCWQYQRVHCWLRQREMLGHLLSHILRILDFCRDQSFPRVCRSVIELFLRDRSQQIWKCLGWWARGRAKFHMDLGFSLHHQLQHSILPRCTQIHRCISWPNHEGTGRRSVFHWHWSFCT